MSSTTNHLDSSKLRQAFSTFMTGVTVATALDREGKPVGFTANSFTSVSLSPPLLLVCPGKAMHLFEVFNECEHFVINVLSELQQDVSNTFATEAGDRFAQVKWHADKQGCPLLEGVVATFSCHVHQRVDAGDHIILIGHIDEFQLLGSRGLGYSNNGYFSLGMEQLAQEAPVERALKVGAIIEYEDCILLERTEQGLRPPDVTVEVGNSARSSIRRHLSAAGLDTELGQVYSIFDSRKFGAAFTYYRAHADSAETGGLGEYIPVSELSAQTYVSATHASMMKRYILERRHGIFGVYVGDEDGGDLHILQE
jgi:flavin reductase (DIM6/NTAB) family NADH-FMN oxidoreductase RutF